jgi:YD repeat-containing protein
MWSPGCAGRLPLLPRLSPPPAGAHRNPTYATTVGRAYDAAGRLTSESLTLPDGNILGTVVSSATSTVGYQYDADNRTTGLTYPTGTQVEEGGSRVGDPICNE